MTRQDFLSFYPQFSSFTPAVVLDTYIALANGRFSGMDEGDAEEARRLYTAHKLTIYSMTVPPVSPAPGEPLSPAVIASAGKAQSAQQVASKKVGEVAVTYATSSHLSGNISTTLADLPETAYGIQLLTLLRQYSRPRYIP